MMSSELPLSTSDVRQEVQIRILSKEGQAALPPTTIMAHWDERVSLMGDKPALHAKVGMPVRERMCNFVYSVRASVWETCVCVCFVQSNFRMSKKNDAFVSLIFLKSFLLHVTQGASVANEPWKTWTWSQYRAEVDNFGKALLTLGCEKFDTINILGFNAPAWLFANFGAIAAGLVPAGIYTTNNATACEYITKHSAAKVVVCEDLKQLSKYFEISKNLPNLKALVMYSNETLPADIARRCSVPCYKFDDFVKLGADGSMDELLKQRSNSCKPGETCTLIYTSGTTGPPKAVMITHDNITWTVQTMILATKKGYMDNSDVMIS